MLKYDEATMASITALHSQGIQISKIAKQLNISSTGVLTFLQKQGLWTRQNSLPYTETQINEMENIYILCKSVWETGKKLNIPGQIVHKYLSQRGVIETDHFSDKEIEEITLEYGKPNSEFSLDDLTRRLNRTSKTGICRIAGELGLTSKKRIAVVAAKNINKVNIPNRWENGNHPKGFKGNTHSEKAKKTISEKSIAAAKRKTVEEKADIAAKAVVTKVKKYGTACPTIFSSNMYSRCKRGKREDLGTYFFRSSWEANYARYLNYQLSLKTIAKWEFEPETFIFTGETRGAISYLPDFKIFNIDGTIEYHEIKGWMDAKSKSKLKKMTKFYPHIKLTIIGQKEYTALEKQYKIIIPYWELPVKKPK